jgi:uncharacterized protein (TIGR02594 family)
MTMTIDYKALQKELKNRGFDPGPVDGIVGRRTIAAVAAFQKAEGLDIKWPGTIGPKTLAALFGKKPEISPLVSKPWFDMALTKKGLHEDRDNAELREFLRADGKTLGDPSKLPWCGDLLQTCIAMTLKEEIIPVNPYLARNWMKFGKACKPTLGAVVVFWRGKKDGYSGHVGFYAGESVDGKVLYVLGGNQSDQISVAPLKADRLLGARWPLTAAEPAKPERPMMIGGKLSINEE